MYLSIQEVQNKWKNSKVRNWSEIYPQLCIFSAKLWENIQSNQKVTGGFTQFILQG